MYILAKGRNRTFYTGFTENLLKRIWEHKNECADGFTKKHGIKTLVYYEIFSDRMAALHREKQLKRYERTWKMRLIEEMNPEWNDLYDAISQ